MQAIDRLALRGEYLIARVDYRRELAIAARYPKEAARILAELAPCIELEHRGGKCPCGLDHVELIDGTNTIVAVLRQSISNQLAGASATNLAVTQIACGTSSAPTTSGMTQLAAEYYRSAPTAVQAVSATQFQAFWYFGTAYANAPSDLQEWGILVGGATAVAGTGQLGARFLQPFTKNSGTTASGQWTLNQA